MMISRVNSELEKQISSVITKELRDPRITGIITIQKVDTSQDLSFSKVYVSILANSDEERKECFEAIRQASGFIRRLVMPKMKMRNMPILDFHLDTGLDYAMHIESILKTLNIQPEKTDDNK